MILNSVLSYCACCPLHLKEEPSQNQKIITFLSKQFEDKRLIQKIEVYPCFIGIVCSLRHIDFRFGVAKKAMP